MRLTLGGLLADDEGRALLLGLADEAMPVLGATPDREENGPRRDLPGVGGHAGHELGALGVRERREPGLGQELGDFLHSGSGSIRVPKASAARYRPRRFPCLL